MDYFDFFPFPLDATASIPMSALIGLLGIGLGFAYYLSEPQSPATRAQGLVSALTGITLAVYTPVYLLRPQHWLIEWLVYVPVIDAAVMATLFAWIFRVARIAQPTARAMLAIKACAWAFAVSTLVYFVVAWNHRELRINEFISCMGLPQGCDTRGFRIFAGPVSAMTLFLAVPMLILFRQRIDAAERVRAVSVAIAAPFFFACYILPVGYNLLSTTMGFLIILVGAIRYHSLQGERGVFLSRFLSPEVVKLVRLQGLAHTLQPQKIELTAVCCDLRGFTNFSQRHDSAQVTRLLGEYYEAVGAVAAEFHATIKDYVGDGILILVGAPLPVADHAAQGLALAQRVRAAARAVTRNWTSTPAPLGVGLGVASGEVTVGAIGSTAHIEYTAVGPAVNLASHLCAQADDGEILTDDRTALLAKSTELVSRGPVAIKGLGETPHFALPAEAPVAA